MSAIPSSTTLHAARLALELLRAELRARACTPAEAIAVLEAAATPDEGGETTADTLAVVVEILIVDRAAGGLLREADRRRLSSLAERGARLIEPRGGAWEATLANAIRALRADATLRDGNAAEALALLGNATATWRPVEDTFPPLSVRWIRARALMRLGHTSAARELIEGAPLPPAPYDGGFDVWRAEHEHAVLSSAWLTGALPPGDGPLRQAAAAFAAAVEAGVRRAPDPSDPFAVELLLLALIDDTAPRPSAKRVNEALTRAGDPAALAAVRELLTASDARTATTARAVAASSALAAAGRSRTVLRDLLIQAASVRALLRVNQTTAAAHAITIYRDVARRATDGRSEDPFDAFVKVDTARLFDRYRGEDREAPDAADEAEDSVGGGIPFTELAGLFAQLASLMARGAIAKTLSPASKKAQIEADDREGLARAIGRYLQRRRGAIVKVGQLTSYFSGPLAEFVRREFEVLGTRVLTMPFGVVERTIARELGAPVASLFETFEPTPFAAGSVGQVHRATLADGRRVAVKVQFEHVDELIDQQLKAARLASRALKPWWPGSLDVTETLREIGKALERETDYREELLNGELFRAAFAGDPEVLIPAAVPELSAQRVLTTELVDGLSFGAFRATADEARRAWAARTILRVTYRSVYGLGTFNTDPQPGNFIFTDDRVAFIDFGSVRRFSPAYVRGRNEVLRDLLGAQGIDVVKAAVESGFVRPGASPTAQDIRDFFAQAVFLALEDGPRRVPADYPDRIFKAFVIGRDDRAGLMLPEDALFVSRLYLGTMALLRDLDVELDFRSELSAALAEAAPGSTEKAG